jgi:molecular chaperone Hsp33
VSELHSFLFEGLPVRGMLVRLTDSWQEVLRRHRQSGGYPMAVTELLGEMSAAAVLMQGNIKFNGALILQVFGDGPVKLAVAEAQPDGSFRATATVRGEVADGVPLSHMVNIHNGGRCAITLDPKDRLPGQQPYQGVVPLFGDRREKLERMSDVLEHYMLQSEQLDTRLVLAANDQMAAGLLIQRMPTLGEANLSGQAAAQAREDAIGRSDDYNRIALLAASLQKHELLTLDADTILHRLFWQEPLQRFEPATGVRRPRFACSCSRERVAGMLQGLGVAEVDSILAEQGRVDIGCEFCGVHYMFDPVDAAQLFVSGPRVPSTGPGQVH